MLPVGIAPTTRRFEAGRSVLLSYGSLLKWCAGAVLPRLPPQCRCGDLLVIYRRVMPRDAAMKWRPRMDSHHQPPDSKSGAPLLSYRARNGADYRCCPGLICLARIRSLALRAACGRQSRAAFGARFVYKTSAWLLCQVGGKWRKPEVMLPILRSRTIRFRGGPGALVRFSFHVEIGESPRCCPVLRGLRDRCIAAMLATQSGSQWSCSTSCGCSSARLPTGGGALVRFDFQKWLPRMDSRHQPPGSEPGALAVELQGNTIRQPELHRSLADTSGVRRYQRFDGI